MPVETLVIVPTSRGVSCGVKRFARLADAGERVVEDALQAVGSACSWAQRFPVRWTVRRQRSASGFACAFSSSPTPFSSDAR